MESNVERTKAEIVRKIHYDYCFPLYWAPVLSLFDFGTALATWIDPTKESYPERLAKKDLAYEVHQSGPQLKRGKKSPMFEQTILPSPDQRMERISHQFISSRSQLACINKQLNTCREIKLTCEAFCPISKYSVRNRCRCWPNQLAIRSASSSKMRSW